MNENTTHSEPVTMSRPVYDIFLSYRHLDRQRLLELFEELKAVGLNVWYDGHIDDFAPINKEVSEALASSKAMLAFYSRDYPASHACQWELRTAFISALNARFEPTERILVINPEATPEHIQPQRLRNAHYYIFRAI